MHFNLVHYPEYSCISFTAMASDCEILLCSRESALLQRVAHLAIAEVKRIEQKFSRYITKSVIGEINNANGERIKIDAETYRLLNFATQCFEHSDGLFDISTGTLYDLWHFKADMQLPSESAVAGYLARVGWSKAIIEKSSIQLPQGMKVDFGGFGKEYAVDRVTALIQSQFADGFVVNFGGDIAAIARTDEQPWRLGIESPESDKSAMYKWTSQYGCYATSGTTRRYVQSNGKTYSHILNPRTGWPVEGAAKSITVRAESCLTAGMLSTVALLHGAEAETFLAAQQTQHWCIR